MESVKNRKERKRIEQERKKQQRKEKGLATLETLRVIADISRILSLIERAKNYFGF